MVSSDAHVITLIKPHYEADPALLVKGVLPEEDVDGVVNGVRADVVAADFAWLHTVRSPIKGAKGNSEVLALLKPQ